MAVHSALLFFEFASRHRVLPYVRGHFEREFRPTGLLAHPLNNGLFYATLVPIAFCLRLPFSVRSALAVLFLFSALAAGARFASVCGSVALVIAMLVAGAEGGRTRSSTGQALVAARMTLTLAALPFVAIAALGTSLGYRLAAGLFDHSARARLNVYQLLAYLPSDQLWTGTSSEQLSDWSFALFHQNTVESPIVASIFIFGIVYSVFLFSGMVAGLFAITRNAGQLVKLSALTFFIVGLSNNVFVVKVPALLFAFVVCAGFGAEAARPQRSQGVRAKQ
jgi:hypothetical protein